MSEEKENSASKLGPNQVSLKGNQQTLTSAAAITGVRNNALLNTILTMVEEMYAQQFNKTRKEAAEHSDKLYKEYLRDGFERTQKIVDSVKIDE